MGLCLFDYFLKTGDFEKFLSIQFVVEADR
jgi:hypothetical protein